MAKQVGGRASAVTEAIWGYLKSLSPVNAETISGSAAAPFNRPKRNRAEPPELKLVSSWTKHLKDDKEREEFKNLVLGSQIVLSRLAEIVEEKMRAREVFKEEDYKDPSWAHRCSDRNGYFRALREVLKILKGVDHDTTTTTG